MSEQAGVSDQLKITNLIEQNTREIRTEDRNTLTSRVFFHQSEEGVAFLFFFTIEKG